MTLERTRPNGNKQRQDDWRVGRLIRLSDPPAYERYLLEAKQSELVQTARSLGVLLADITDSTASN